MSPTAEFRPAAQVPASPVSAPSAALSAASPAATAARRFRLQVRQPGKAAEWVELAAASEADAILHAAGRGWQVLALQAAQVAERQARAARAGAFPLLLFSQELLALLEAGLNLTEAIATLHAKEGPGAVRDRLAAVLQALREGRNLSDVLEDHPQDFPDVYVATVRASERTGDLPHALARYIAYQLQFDGISKKLVSAAIYPVMLLVVGGFVTLFLLGYVVPRFSAVYESSGRDLPGLSLMLLAFGKLIHAHWQAAVAGAFAALAGLGWALSRPAGRGWLVNQVLKVPVLARRADDFRLARFFRAVSLLLASGIALPRALGMVTGLLSPAQQQALRAARLAIDHGQPLSQALREHGLSGAVADSFIRVGERSGQMAEMLERTARFHDEDFGRWVDWASRLLEPVLMAVIGLIVGTVVVLMYMPIFDLAGSLQ
ncbi:MAG: type II secretion system F family protein [Proteobacteria bacterium]|nr:type II secretion system F family protein [Pseudomonadota bacterium]